VSREETTAARGAPSASSPHDLPAPLRNRHARPPVPAGVHFAERSQSLGATARFTCLAICQVAARRCSGFFPGGFGQPVAKSSRSRRTWGAPTIPHAGLPPARRRHLPSRRTRTVTLHKGCGGIPRDACSRGAHVRLHRSASGWKQLPFNCGWDNLRAVRKPRGRSRGLPYCALCSSLLCLRPRRPTAPVAARRATP